MSEHTCVAIRYKDWSEYICGKPAKYEHDGKWYCKTCHPPSKQDRKEARETKWRAGMKAESEHHAKTRAIAYAERAVIDAAKLTVTKYRDGDAPYLPLLDTICDAVDKLAQFGVVA